MKTFFLNLAVLAAMAAFSATAGNLRPGVKPGAVCSINFSKQDTLPLTPTPAPTRTLPFNTPYRQLATPYNPSNPTNPLYPNNQNNPAYPDRPATPLYPNNQSSPVSPVSPGIHSSFPTSIPIVPGVTPVTPMSSAPPYRP